MLSQMYPPEQLKTLLIPREAWHPFPTASEREAWETLPNPVRQAHLARGEAGLGYEWPPVLAVRFLDYVRDGNRSRYESVSFGRRSVLRDLVLAECMEGEGRFLDDILNGIWAICEESFWGASAHLGMQKAGPGLPDVTEPIVDLFAAETSALLAWTAYLLGPQLQTLSPLILPRIEYEIQRRILTPLLEREDFGWMGFQGQRVNNWNPWICSNWLTSTLILEKDEGRRLASVAKAMRTLDHFIDPYPKDGGCDEGPSYWGRAGASLYDCLELLYSATGGKVNVYDQPLIQEIGRFIYRVHIADRYFVNFADAPALVTPPAVQVYGYGRRIHDPALTALGAWLARETDLLHRGFRDSLGRTLPGLFSQGDLLGFTDARPPLPRDAWLPEIQVMVARDQEGRSDGLFVAAKGGHNAESHNHNDVGNFIVYVDGRPVIVDAGVGTYTAKTFSSRRYEIWTMQSAYHNLPTINGVQQAPGRSYQARDARYTADEASAQLTLDIAGAYPAEAGVRRWTRSVRLERGHEVQVTDVYDLNGPPQQLTLSLLTPCEAIPQGHGSIRLAETSLPDGRSSGEAEIHYDPGQLTAQIETISIEDGRLKRTWGGHLYRLVLEAQRPKQQGSWTIRLV